MRGGCAGQRALSLAQLRSEQSAALPPAGRGRPSRDYCPECANASMEFPHRHRPLTPLIY
jgi:hypothetical protein